jgi:tetratricopeptide (TPR) repeat protein
MMKIILFKRMIVKQSIILLGILADSDSCSAQAHQVPTAATNANVKTENLPVFQEMDKSSHVARSLSKGDSVYVDLRVDQGSMSWCGVRVPGQQRRIGFVDCRSLERVGNLPGVNAVDPGSIRTGSGATRAMTGEVPLARPSLPTQSEYDKVHAEVVKDGVVNSAYILMTETVAKSGGSAAVTRAALAHFAAAEFALSQHDLDSALDHFAAMEPFCGQQRDLLIGSLLGRAYTLLLRSEFSAALEPIERARKVAPLSAEAASLAGWAHYRLNQNDAAIADLQIALRLRPSESTAHLLERVKQDSAVEGDFREGESSHFVVRYHGGTSHQLASDVIRALEEEFQELRSELRYSPPEPIGVVLYTEEAFRDVTRVPNWTGAANDGRIRVPVQGMETVTPELARILKHELAHSFIFQKTAGRCPTWLQEGLAQWIEGRRTGSDAKPLVAAFEEEKGKALRYGEGSWMHLSTAQAGFAYAWSLAVVEMIESESGADAINRLLDAERSESSGEAALLQGLRTDFSGLDDATITFLRRTYLQ